jgi:hypothetical protein
VALMMLCPFLGVSYQNRLARPSITPLGAGVTNRGLVSQFSPTDLSEMVHAITHGVVALVRDATHPGPRIVAEVPTSGHARKFVGGHAACARVCGLSWRSRRWRKALRSSRV